jgi:transcriptional regulator with XRE-family HTH domain
MDKEKEAFAARLRAALEAKGIEARPAVVEKRFNSRYGGAAVTAQAVSGWLNGRSMPKQDKLRVLAQMVGLEPQELQYGVRPRIGDGGADWPQALGASERVMLDAYFSLPGAQRKLVRELVANLARAYEVSG